MLQIDLIRFKRSFLFKSDPSLPDGFDNNWQNNSQDDLILTRDYVELFRCKCQSVANYCFGDNATGDTISYGDTIREGKFQVKCFVPPRKFHGEVHAIINTTDLDGQKINHDAMQITAGGYQNGRWLIHDRYSFKTNSDTRYAWSAGCFILSSADLRLFNAALRSAGVQAGDIINGRVTEKGGDYFES